MANVQVYPKASAREFLDIPEVQQQIAMAAEVVGREAQSSFHKTTDDCLRHVRSLRFDSPLEVMFWVWWHGLERGYPWVKDAVALVNQHEVTVDGERFRLDFCVEGLTAFTEDLSGSGLVWPHIGIEVDGHGFHERTRDQVALRDRRDRALMKDNWRVFHFSWGEFTKHPEETTREVWDYVADQYHDLFKTRHGL